jgi:hypothetical protein
MPPVEFEPMIFVSERPQTYALDRVAIGTGVQIIITRNKLLRLSNYTNQFFWYHNLIVINANKRLPILNHS